MPGVGVDLGLRSGEAGDDADFEPATGGGASGALEPPNIAGMEPCLRSSEAGGEGPRERVPPLCCEEAESEFDVETLLDALVRASHGSMDIVNMGNSEINRTARHHEISVNGRLN